EEADGLWNLKNNDNRGDGGDIYPGVASNTSFTNVTVPNSLSNFGNPTNVEVTAIGISGDPMTATMKGGYFPPAAVSVVPDSGYTDSGVVGIDLFGSGFNHGATFALSDGGPPFAASYTEWVGHEKLTGNIELTGLASGYYDIVVTNPDGQTSVMANAFQVIDTTTTDSETPGVPTSFALGQNVPNPFNPSTKISFDIAEQSSVSLKIYDINGRVIRTLVNSVMAPDRYEVNWDGRNENGSMVASGVYFYRLQAGSGFRAVRKLVLMR
ncbi:MAG TPA: FlgD immunoglobulin-like domain containing protein, partial [Candidatus Krumholzibacterium sp.]|nr:FlgD immunoglobulin-like domain containing protein [Candidatus Krumholzibacterium sp.]